MITQNLYELTFTIHQPATEKVLYTNAIDATQALLTLLDEYDTETLKSLQALSIAQYNPATGAFDKLDMDAECSSFVMFCKTQK